MQKRLLFILVFWGWIVPAAFSQLTKTSGLPPSAFKDKGQGFTENKGQLLDQQGKPSKAVKYLLNMPGLKVQLRQTGFSYDTYIKKAGKKPGTSSVKFHRVDIELIGANPNASITNSAAIAGSSSVINELGEFYDIHRFRNVTYHDIYPGIDLEFVAHKGATKPVEYNFIVRPGGDASQIRLKYNGANQTSLRNGHIVMGLNHGKLMENIPASWVKQTKKPVQVDYKALGSDVYAFNIPSYDKSKTLVIDPTPQVIWSTYYGGAGEDRTTSMVSDSQGNIYVGGYTSSSSAIATSGAYDGTFGGGTVSDGFLAKFNNDGQLIWGTYYGGTGTDLITSIAIKDNVVIIGGVTTSAGMSTTGAHQTAQTATGQNTGFLAKFDASTGQRTWGSYYGGSIGFTPGRISIDADNNFYAYGYFETGSLSITGANVATAGTFKPTVDFGTLTTNANQSGLVKFNQSNVRQWGTYIDFSRNSLNGQTTTTTITGAMTLDADGQVYVTGGTSSRDLAANTTEGQTYVGTDGFILKMNKANGQRTWGRYFGGAGTDYIYDVLIDPATQTIYTTGMAKSSSGIATPGTFIDNVPVGYQNSATTVRGGFLASFDMNGTQKMGTYLSQSFAATTIATNLALGKDGNLILLALSNDAQADLATDCSYMPNRDQIGSTDIVVNKFTPQGQRVWGTYLGTTAADSPYGFGNVADGRGKTLALDPDGNIFLTYNTSGTGAATTGAHQATNGGGTFDGVIAKLNEGTLPSNFAVAATTLTPQNQTACILGIPAVIVGNAVGVTTPANFPGKIFYQWQKANSSAGPWEDMPGEVFKDLQPLASQTTIYYRRLVKMNTTLCNQEVVATSPTASVVISSSVSPIADANGPQWYVCGTGANTVPLTGTASGGAPNYTYRWYDGSTSNGTLVASTAAWTTPAVTQATTYTLQVTDAAGCVDIDQVTIVPAVADAGVDKSICQGTGGIQIGTPPVSSPSVNYAWTLVSGSPISSLSCTNCAQPIANPTVATTYRLTVTVTRKGGTTTCTTTDDIIVTPVAAPNNALVFAGTDKTICQNTPVTLGGTADNSFAYTWATGQYLSNAQIANPVFDAGTATVSGGAITYAVTAVKNGCAFNDEVKVSVINSRITDQDELNCGPMWSYHLGGENAAGATYSWSVVSGNGTILQTSGNGKNAYLKSNSGVTRFRRTVSLNGVTCTADLDVQPCSGPGCDFDIVTLSAQECPKVFGQAGLTLGTTLANATNYNFSWSPANLVDKPNAATVKITSTAQATITVTVTNKYDGSITCSESIVINPPGWSLATFTAADKYTCPNTAVQIGSTPISGYSYEWATSNALSSTTVANPTATVAATTPFYVKITENASGCVRKETVTVNVSAPLADAGKDRAVCNGATVTLGTEPPGGTGWVYSWSPSNAAWTNGTNASSAQPQLQFAFASPQTYTLTVTDPLSGCSATDQVVLRNTVLAGEYAGAGQTTCQGAPVQLGAEAQPYAQYEWFMANGVTPATGLSSNTVANPTVLNPTATTIYTVKVSYPGCSTPISDQVTLTVNPVSGLALIDKTVCPAGPIAIGYGSTGNPTAPSGATYLWSPATGLSSATAANPTATVTSERIYSVTVTLASGCTFTDQVKVSPSANAGPDAILCPGESTVVGTPAVAGATYAWSGGTFVGATNIAQPTVRPTATTTYTVSVTLNGCTTTDQVIVTVNTPASFAINGNTALCVGGVTTLSLAGTSPVNTTWQWSPLAGVSSPNSPSTTIAPTATQTYRLTQTDLLTGCSNYKEVVVVVNPNNIAATVGNVDVCAASATALPLNVTSTGTYSYVWAPSTGLSSAYVASPTVTTSSARTYTVTVTDNTSKCQLVKSVDVAINPAEACYPAVTLTGNVYHDANALKDISVNNSSANAIPTGLYVTLVNASGTAVKTVAVNSNGTYDFGTTPAGDYSIVLHQTSSGSTVPSLPTGWINTGENLGAGVGNDAAIDGILNGISIAGTNVTNANFGVQQPPVTSDGAVASQTNPGGTTTVNLTSQFAFSDADGTVSTITFTSFPADASSVTINGTTYVPTGTTPGSGQSVWPGPVTVSTTGLSVLVDPVDGNANVSLPYIVTDNGGATSNQSTVMAPFTTAPVTLSGNVFHDTNALSDNTVNSSATTPALPTGLYVSLLGSNGSIVATTTVAANGSYNFGNVTPGTYSVVLHQTSAGSATPSLPTGWINTGENLGSTAGSDALANGILPNIVVATTNVTNANLGVQQPPVTSNGTVASQPNPGGNTTVDLTSEFDFSDADGTVSTITFTSFPADVSSVTINGTTYVPAGTTPGSGQSVWPGPVTVSTTGLTVLVDPIVGDANVSVPFTVKDNGGSVSNQSTVTAPFTTPLVTVSGNVFHDANALSDGTVNETAASPAIPTGLYVSLLDGNGDVVATTTVGANGAYDFGNVTPGAYSVVLHQTAAGSVTPSLPADWINTGENLGASAGSDASVNGILPAIVVTTTDITNANFGVQTPPVTTDESVASQPNPGGAVTADLSSEFNFTDSDGTVETITFTQFPADATTITINGTTYVAPGETPGSGQTVFPASGVTVPVTGLSVLVDPLDGDVTVYVPFKVTDNGGSESNESTVMAPFTTPLVTVSGNVFHDANALSDGTVNESAASPAIPTGLYVSLVDANGDVVATVAVAANGAYDFGNVTPGTYSVVLHQTAAGSTTPNLPADWINTGENLGSASGSDASVNGILPAIVVTTTDVTNANFGVQMPSVTTDEALASQPNPGGVVTADLSSEFNFTDSDGTIETITFTQFPADATTISINGITYVAPGETPGAGQTVFPASGVTVPVTGLSILVDPVDGDVTVSVPFKVTDNAGSESNQSTVTAPFTTPLVTVSGNVFHDANALSDGTVNESAASPAIPTGLYVSLLDANGDVVETVAVGANGTYDFGNVTPGTYSVVLHQTAAGSVTPSLPSGWINTGENLGATAGSDASVNGILPAIVVTTTDVTNANFGVQQPPVAADKGVGSQPNPGGVVTTDLSVYFTSLDNDGTVETITFTQFPADATTITINGTTYVAPGETPGSGQTVFPASGVTVPVTGLSVLVDPIDGDVTVSVPFKVTDNAGAESNESTVTAPFTTPLVTVSGNVFHDANALSDGTVNESAATPAIPTGLYVSLLDANGDVVATVAVGANGAYDFGNVTPGTYSVVLHQTAAGSVTPNLPSGWINTGENLGAAAGSDASVNGILPAIVVTTTDVTNANFGVQQPPVAQPKNYVIDQPAPDAMITLNGSLVTNGSGHTAPGQMTGQDQEDGTLNGSGTNRTVVITTLPANGLLYYNGALVTPNQRIDNYDPSLMQIKLTGSGYNSVTFRYAFMDQAGMMSAPVDYTIRWGVALPVTLIAFQAKAVENTAQLSWTTASETGSDRFQVQRSQDGKDWSVLGEIAAKGESRQTEKYAYSDRQPKAGNNLYRLKMIDLDGTFAFSSISSVSFENKFETSIYPNPVTEKLNLDVSDWTKVKSIRIDDMTGHKVYESGNTVSKVINVGNLPSGMYVIRITTLDGLVRTHKMVHIK